MLDRIRLLFSAYAAALIALFALADTADAQKAAPAQITVFAAASLKNALDEAAAAYRASTGTNVVVSYAASSALAKQIEQAAPADVFISADLDWMDYLAGKDLIVSSTRTNLLGNRLVLVAPAESGGRLDIAEGFALATLIGDGKLAVGDVKAVPAGKYAKAALEKLKVWKEIEPKLAQTENVRAALALVARGEANFAIVYQTDALAEPTVKIIATFPETTHAPIIYPAAVVKSAPAGEAAQSFLAFLTSPQGEAAFRKAGFINLATAH